MTDQAPALVVVTPLLCAPLCILLRSRSLPWLLFLLAGSGTFALALLLALRVARDGPLRYHMGGWPAPYGIEFVVAEFNTPVLLLVGLIAVLVAVYARRSLAVEIAPGTIQLVYTCLCLTLAGLVGLTITGDVFNAFVFLEISSLSTYALVATGGRRRALVAGLRYLVIGTVGATFLLIGIGLAYAVTGTLNMADLADRVGGAEGNRALYAAVAFVFVGLAVKMAVVPLHTWLPPAYGEAPSAVGMLLAAVSTKVAIYIFCRLAFTAFGAGLVFGSMPIDRIALFLACIAMLLGSAVACFQDDLKYVLAWSSIAQIGYIVAGVSLATSSGVSAAYLHIINHAVMKAALFAIAGLLVLRLGSARLPDLAGLGRRMPATFAALVIAGLGLIGVPPTAGFASKWALVTALVERDQWPAVAAVLVSSLLALVYVGRVVGVAWFDQPVEPRPAGSPQPPVSMVAAVWLLAGLTVYLGVGASLPVRLAEAAAAALLGTGGG